MSVVNISHINSSSPKYALVWQLREDVLRKPLGLSLKNEDLGQDHKDIIVIAESGNDVIGCLMLSSQAEGKIKLRQMAVSDAWQGKGVGRQLVQTAERLATEKGYKRIVLHARKAAMGFYLSLGYKVRGDEFTEVGIPHYAMEKEI